MNIGNAIKEIRKEAGLNQASFSDKIGITQCYLSQIERGHKNPSLKILEKVSREIKLPLAMMLWFGIEDCDIADSKKEAYSVLKPSIDTMINSLFNK